MKGTVLHICVLINHPVKEMNSVYRKVNRYLEEVQVWSILPWDVSELHAAIIAED